MPSGLRYALIVALALAMGVQNATARKLAVPDLTTTVLTLTITGLAADSPLAGATGARVARRLISVLAMFLGALAGACSCCTCNRLSPGAGAAHPGRGGHRRRGRGQAPRYRHSPASRPAVRSADAP